MGREQLVNITYRGFELASKQRVSGFEPASVVLDYPAPMPVGTELALVPAEGLVVPVRVVRVKEQVAGSDEPPSMLLEPLSPDDAALAWWHGEAAELADTLAGQSMFENADASSEATAVVEGDSSKGVALSKSNDVEESSPDVEAENAQEDRVQVAAAETGETEANGAEASDVSEGEDAAEQNEIAAKEVDATRESVDEVSLEPGAAAPENPTATKKSDIGGEEAVKAEQSVEQPVAERADSESVDDAGVANAVEASASVTKATTVMSADEIQAVLETEIAAASVAAAESSAASSDKSAVGKSKKKKRRRRRRKTKA